jgi:hypothetical protein
MSARSGSFTFSEPLSDSVSTGLLHSEYPDGDLIFQIFRLLFPEVCRTIAERVLGHNLSILPFAPGLFSADTEQMSEAISFLNLADFLAFRSVSSDLAHQLIRFFLRPKFVAGHICATIPALLLASVRRPSSSGTSSGMSPNC